MTVDTGGTVTVRAVGRVESPITTVADAPHQGDEGAPAARVVIFEEYAAAADGIRPGDRVVVLTWLHLADRSALSTRPRGDPGRDPTGVFATRSPDRPNPIGLHEVTVVDVGGGVLTVDALEAVDGTPVLDVKSALGRIEGR